MRNRYKAEAIIMLYPLYLAVIALLIGVLLPTIRRLHHLLP